MNAGRVDGGKEPSELGVRVAGASVEIVPHSHMHFPGTGKSPYDGHCKRFHAYQNQGFLFLSAHNQAVCKWRLPEKNRININ